MPRCGCSSGCGCQILADPDCSGLTITGNGSAGNPYRVCVEGGGSGGGGCEFNVRDYGATGDGVTNDFDAFQDAVDAADAIDGATVCVPPGTYKFGVDNVSVPMLMMGDNTWLKGSGQGNTILRWAAHGDLVTNHGMINNKGTLVAHGGTGLGNVGLKVTDMTLDGNKGSSTAFRPGEQGLYWTYVEDFVIASVTVKNFKTDGVAISQCRQGQLYSVIAEGNLKAGHYCVASDHVRYFGCTARGNGSSTGPLVGVGFEMALAWWCDLHGCESYGNLTSGLTLSRDTRFLHVVGGTYQHIDSYVAQLTAPTAAEARRGAQLFDHIQFGGPNPYAGGWYGVQKIDFDGVGILGYPGVDGFTMVGMDHSNIRGCTVTTAGRRGIALLGCSNNLVVGNEIQNWGGDGVVGQTYAILVIDDNDSTPLGAANNEIRNNRGSGGPDGITVSQIVGGVTGTRQSDNNITVTIGFRYYLFPGLPLLLDESGSGTPEGVVGASPGSQWHRTDGGAGTCLYVKETGAGTNTGWVGK